MRVWKKETGVNRRTRVGQGFAVCAHNTSGFSESIRPLAFSTNIWECDNCGECENVLESGRLWIGRETRRMFGEYVTFQWPQKKRGKRVTLKVSWCSSFCQNISFLYCYLWLVSQKKRKVERKRLFEDILRDFRAEYANFSGWELPRSVLCSLSSMFVCVCVCLHLCCVEKKTKSHTNDEKDCCIKSGM